jgi:Arc/MetJ family transcription regulator
MSTGAETALMSGHSAAIRPSVHLVYTTCIVSRIRTNIEIEEVDVRLIMERFGLRTKTDAVALALRQLAGQPMTREEALAMRGARAITDVQDGPGPQNGDAAASPHGGT